jgi:hypothetical protein
VSLKLIGFGWVFNLATGQVVSGVEELLESSSSVVSFQFFGHLPRPEVPTRVLLLLSCFDSWDQLGVGLTPSGLYTNEVLYALASDVVWSTGDDEELDGWIPQYIRSRYGIMNADLVAAWKLLSATVYSYSSSSERIFSQRPSLGYSPPPGNVSFADAVFQVQSSSPGLVPAPCWHSNSCLQAWSHYHAVALQYGSVVSSVDAFVFDYVDLTRQVDLVADTDFASRCHVGSGQVVVELFDGLYAQLTAAYTSQDGQGARNIGTAMHQLATQLDDVLSAHTLWMLGNWTTSAGYCALLAC